MKNLSALLLAVFLPIAVWAAEPDSPPAPTARLSLTHAVAAGQLELRPFPSVHDKGRYFLRGEETPATLVLPIDRKSRESGFELPLGFWQLIYRDGGERRLELPLTPFKAERDGGHLALSFGSWRLQIVDEEGAPIAGALVGQQSMGFVATPWQPAFCRRESDRNGWVSLPRGNRSLLWILAPGYQALLHGIYSNEWPSRLTLVRKEWTRLQVRDRFRRPLAGALISSRQGVPLGLTDDEGELEGPFADREQLLVTSSAGEVWRERIFRSYTGKLRMQVPQGDPLRGEVVDRYTGEALEGAWVWLEYQKEHWTRTDKNGVFEIYDLYKEPSGLRADAPGYSLGFSPADRWAPTIIRLYPSDRVLFGTVRDLAGEPIAGARVNVSTEGKKAKWSALTDEEGHYRISGLPAEKAWAEAGKSGYFPESKSFHRTFPEVRLNFELEEGAKVVGQLVASRGGAPLAQARIRRDATSHDPTLLGTTDQEGFFEVGPLHSGEHKLVLEGRGYARKEIKVRIAKNEAVQDLGTIELADEELWDGRVVDEDGQPLPDVRIFAWTEPRRDLSTPPWRSADATTDDDGHFELQGLAEGQVVELEFRAEGRPPILEKNVSIIKETQGRNWIVPEGARLTIKVRDPRVESVFYADVYLLPQGSDDPMENWQVTDEEGLAEYPQLLPGVYQLKVKAENFGVWRRDIELEKGQRRTVVVTLGEEGSALQGRILPPPGQPPAPYRVSLETGENSWPPAVTTRVDIEGFYRLEGLPTGTFELRVSKGDFPIPLHRQKVELSQPQNFLDIELPATGLHALGVLVLDELGKPLAGVDVSIMVNMGDINVGTGLRTDPDGTVIFPDLPGGVFNVSAAAPDDTWNAAGQEVELERGAQELVLVLKKKVESEAAKPPEPEP